MKGAVLDIIKKALKELKVDLSSDEINRMIEVPHSKEMGDYSFPCFSLSKKLKLPPNDIAISLREKIGDFPLENFEDVQTSGAYVNFFVNKKFFVKKVLIEVLSEKNNYGKLKTQEDKTIVIDFSSPNIAKPFHIGHLRSTIIGNSLANISKSLGFRTKKINYLGDWGTQFGKLIFGFQRFGDEKKLKKNPLEHLLEIYIKVSKNKKYEENSRAWFNELEKGNETAVQLWKIFRKISINNFEEIYKKLGISFNEVSSESSTIKNIDNVMDILKEKKLLKKSKGALIVDLRKYSLGVCMIKKTDGSSTYAVRDIAEAIRRYKKYNFDKMIYEVGMEQVLHFKQIFKVLELMGFEWFKNCVHVSHGFYLGKDKKKFSTRNGKLIYLNDILNKTESLAKIEIKKRTKKISKEELSKRAWIIAIASIFYGDLKNYRLNNIVFDLKKFTSFEGDSGPYLEYSYARASSILRKIKKSSKKQELKNEKNFSINSEEINEKEYNLVVLLSKFGDVVLDSYKNLNPALIANYSYELSKAFNEFYNSCPVIGSPQEKFRIAIVKSFRQVLKNSLSLLGIETLEKM